MDNKLPEIGVVNVKLTKDNGVFKKSSSVSIKVYIKDKPISLIFSHERKAYSDFFFHRNPSLIKSSFIYYIKNDSGTWYHYDSIQQIENFIGIKFSSEINPGVLKVLEESSVFSDNELGG